LQQISEQLCGIKLHVERLSDNILYAHNLQGISDTTQKQQQLVQNLRDIRESLEPASKSLQQNILSSAIILTPEKMRQALIKNPWEILFDVRPANLSTQPTNPELIPILFEHNKLQYIGWQLKGTLPILFDCEYHELWIPSNISSPINDETIVVNENNVELFIPFEDAEISKLAKERRKYMFRSLPLNVNIDEEELIYILKLFGFKFRGKYYDGDYLLFSGKKFFSDMSEDIEEYFSQETLLGKYSIFIQWSTGLIWLKRGISTESLYSDALSFLKYLYINKQQGWRLPTIEEACGCPFKTGYIWTSEQPDDNSKWVVIPTDRIVDGATKEVSYYFKKYPLTSPTYFYAVRSLIEPNIKEEHERIYKIMKVLKQTN
jgi:hypothetical protein